MDDDELKRLLAAGLEANERSKHMPMWFNVPHNIPKPEGPPVFIIRDADPWQGKVWLDTSVRIIPEEENEA